MDTTDASKPVPIAYSFNVKTPSQLIDLMTDQDVYLPSNLDPNQMANIRFIILTRRLGEVPFEIQLIGDVWFIGEVLRRDLSPYLKRGDRLLIIHKTMISNQLEAADISKLMLHSAPPFLLWVTWDPDTFLKHQALLRQSSSDQACINAKAYLLQTRSHADISLYDHLATILANALRNPSANSNVTLEPSNAILHYPVLSSDLRSAETGESLNLMKIHRQLLQGTPRKSLRPKDYQPTAVPNLMDMNYYCSSAGYGLHTNEMILIWSAMKRLNDRIRCQEMIFWGKVFGLYGDYYIVQVRDDGETDLRQESDGKGSTQPPKPVEPQWTALMEIPSEPHGTGTNRYSYFVTNSPGLPWTKLADVKPAMIDSARKIRSFFTGCLSSPVHGYPLYPGLEKDYLRAQIARITATTHISPTGFYILSDLDEGEEESFPNPHQDPSILPNPEFNNDPSNPTNVEALANRDLQEWVHSQPEILPQGRTRFWKPPISDLTAPPFEEETEEDEQRSRADSANTELVQIPAPLLQPIGEDKLAHGTDQSAWSIGLTMSIMREYSLCYVRSNVWPGAFTLGHAGGHLNVYVGWGQKCERFNPSLPPPLEREYEYDLIEVNDPSVQLEKAVEEAQRANISESSVEEFTSDEEGEESLSGEEI